MAGEEQTQAVETKQAPEAPPATTGAQDAQANTQTAPAAAEKGNTKSELTLEEALRELKDARAEAAKYRTAAKAREREKTEAEEAALKEQGKYKELYDKLQSELKAQADEIAKRDRIDMQRRVAEKVGLPVKLASKIGGETEAEMEADAVEMRAALPAAIVGNDGKAGAAAGTKNAAANIGGMTREQLAQFLGTRSEFIPER